MTDAPKFYDHAKNHTNVAIAAAVARARRDAIADGNAYRVEATPRGGGRRFWWNGSRYDALALARDLAFNNYENVVLTRADGTIVDITRAIQSAIY